MKPRRRQLRGGEGVGAGRGDRQEVPAAEPPDLEYTPDTRPLARAPIAWPTDGFLEVTALPEDDGGGFCARLRADPVRLVGDGETSPEALADLGARCARFAKAQQPGTAASPPSLPALSSRPVPPAWQYRRKTTREINKLARRVNRGEVYMGYGTPAIEAGWPVLVNELRANGISEAMHRAGVVAFYEEVGKAHKLPGGQTTFLGGEQLDSFDWARFVLAKEKPAALKQENRAVAALKTAAKAAELLVRAPLRFLLALRPRA